MKQILRSKLNKKTLIGISLILLTVLYLVITTAIAQDDTKKAGTGIQYTKDHLSFGDVWTFDAAARTASNYSKTNVGTDSYYSSSTKTDNGTTGFTKSIYQSVTFADRKAPTGTTMPSHAEARFVGGTLTKEEMASPVNPEVNIPVVSTTNTNNVVRYSVVPDTTGTYHVYAYSDKGTPVINYFMLDSCEASIDYNAVSGLPNKPLNFEPIGHDWYCAEIEVTTVRWHAVAPTVSRKNLTSSTNDTGLGTFQGGQDIGTGLTTTTYYYNEWGTTNVDYNTVIVFQFTKDSKLGPVTKSGDTIKIINADPTKGSIEAFSVFGESLTVGEAVKLDHCPVIVKYSSETAILDESNVLKGSGQLEAVGDDYVYSYEDLSELEFTWTKLVDLPTIHITGGSDPVSMNFFAAKKATIHHPGGQKKTYNFTVDFKDALDLKTLTYSYTANGREIGSGTLTDAEPSFEISNVNYENVVVTFTAVSNDNDSYTATCTITRTEVDAAAPFKVGNNYFFTWEAAMTEAVSRGTQQVVLNASYTLPDSLHGNGLLENGSYVYESGGRLVYRVPNNIVFVVPHMADYTYVSNKGDTYHTYSVQTQNSGNGGNAVALNTYLFREMIVSSGISINIESGGVMTVGGTTNGSAVIYSTHSNVYLEEDTFINVKSGGVLSSCGYIYGKGKVTTESGSEIYMPFSIIDYRGGGYTVAVGGGLASSYGISNHPSGEKGLSPFLRYTMNAIQCDINIVYGATVTGYLNLNASSEHHNIKAIMIGTPPAKTSDPAVLIQMSTGSTIDISYDASTYVTSYNNIGKTKLTINGNVTFGNISMKITISIISATIDTAKTHFPIPYNYDIEVESGKLTVPNNIMLLPGAHIEIKKGATLDANASLTIYDGLHDYSSSGTNENNNVVLKGWESGSGNPKSQSTYTNTINSIYEYPSTSQLQAATFGGSGTADLVVNGTMNLNAGSTIAGIIQTDGNDGAKIVTASGIGTSTTTQIGAVGTSSVPLNNSYHAGATVRTLKGEIIDTGTGMRTAIVGNMTYLPTTGVSNISSYSYTLYYDQSQKKVDLTDEIACVLQGSWYNYVVNVHTVQGDDIIDTNKMYFAHGADVSTFFTNKECTTKATTVTQNTKDLYYSTDDAEAMIIHDGETEENGTFYLTVRTAVQNATEKGDRIVLLKNLDDFSSVIGPAEDQDFIFDVNGKEIHYRSTPFANNTGGHMLVDVNKGKIFNEVGGRYFDSPVLSLKENCELTLLLNEGSIKILGDKNTQLVNGGVENPGTLTIDLSGGTWEYRTGLVVKKSTAATNQHHDLTSMAPYQSKAMFNNTGTLTLKDTKGGATVTTDLLANGTTLTPATPTTNYTSIIRNNAGATLNLGGGTYTMVPLEDEDKEPILSTAATPTPMALYSFGILNMGTVNTCDDATALTVTTSGWSAVYNMLHGKMDLDLKGGTIEVKPYEAGVEKNTAMYSGKIAVVNDGEMTLRSSVGKGKVQMNVKTSSGAIYGVFNSNAAAILATLTLDNIDIEVPNASTTGSYGVYNRAGSKITGINKTNITMTLGQALNSTGSVTTTTTIGDITDSKFIAGTTETVAGTNAFYAKDTQMGNITRSTFETTGTASNVAGMRLEGEATYKVRVGDIVDSHFTGVMHGAYITYTDVGNITRSTFKGTSSANNMTALKIDGSGAVPLTVGDITGSTFEGAAYGVTATCVNFGDFNDSHFTGGTYYAMSLGSGCYVKSITGGSFKSAASGGLNMTSLSPAATYPARPAHVGDITGVEFTVHTIGINATGAAAIADAAAVAPEFGNITECHFTTNTGNGMTIAGVAANTLGAAAGPKLGDIVECTFNTGAYGFALSGGGLNATGGGPAGPTVGDITGCIFNTGTYGMSVSGSAGNTDFEHGMAQVGDITGNTVNSGTVGIYLAYANAGVIEGCEMEAKNPAANYGAIHIISLSTVEHIEKTNITIPETSTTANAGIYVSGANVGDIIDCDITTNKGYAIIHSTTAALGESHIGKITECEFTSIGAGGINALGGQSSATAPAAAPVFGDITDNIFETATYGMNIVGAQANATGGASAPKVGNITGNTITAGSYGMNIGGGAVSTGGAAAAPTIGNITGNIITAGSYGIQITGAAGNATFPEHAIAEAGDIISNKVYAGTSHGIALSYASAGKIYDCTVQTAASANNIAAIYAANRSSVDSIEETHIKILETSTNTTVAGIYTSASTIGDIIHCDITASKGHAISHNATSALGVSEIGNIERCEIVSGADGIYATGGVATATTEAAAVVIGNITATTFETVTYGMNIASAAANANNVAAGAVVGDITGCTFNAGTYGIQIAGGAGTAAMDYKDVGYAKVGDIKKNTINTGTIGIYLSYCKGTVIEDCPITAKNPASNSYVIYTGYGTELEYIKDCPIKVTDPSTKSYAIYNYGGDIGLIENSPIDAPYGIFNLNVRANANTVETGATLMYRGHIGKIKDMDVKVAQYAFQNRGVVDEIVGTCNFVATNPSAQVPWDHGTIAPSNAAASTFVNSNAWWYDTAIWKLVNDTSTGVLIQTNEYKWEDDYRPTIGKISGNIKIVAENTGNAATNGTAMTNNGVIHEISGNVVIETYVHPDNEVAPYSSVALSNTSGGRIDKIVGNVKISAGASTLTNSTGSPVKKSVVEYKGTATNSGEAAYEREYYYDYVGIGEITGDMNGQGIIIEATHQNGALTNNARIGNITGKVAITAEKGGNALINLSNTSLKESYLRWPEGDGDRMAVGAKKTGHDEYLYAEIGVIGGKNSDITIRAAGSAASTYALQNVGHIEAILDNVVIENTIGINNTPTILNSGDVALTRDYTYENLGFSEQDQWYDVAWIRDYTYILPTIERMQGVTVSTGANYALRNAGLIESIKDCKFTAQTGYGIDNTSSYGTPDGEGYSRRTAHYYHGATPYTLTTQYFGETTLEYSRVPAEIGELDGVEITVNTGSCGIQNAGHIGSIKNSSVKVLAGSYAIFNSYQSTNVATTTHYETTMDGFIYRNADSKWVVTPDASVTDRAWEYYTPVIDSIGEGNTLEALARTIDNRGYIGEIGSADGERTTITATSQTGSNQQAIYNYDGYYATQKRDGSVTSVYTYDGARIELIHNASITSGVTYALQNGAGTANYNPSIGEIGEGTEITAKTNTAVFNHATNAKIEKITGGVFTAGEGNFYALYNNSTAHPIEVLGGDFKGGDDTRAKAIYLPDNTDRYTYPEEMMLGYRPHSVKLADGSTVSGYYYLVVSEFYIVFDGNGATSGTMEPITVKFADDKVELERNAFVFPKMRFAGWAIDEMASSEFEKLVENGWSGTIEEFAEAIGVDEINIGDEITLYAVWEDVGDAITFFIEWGSMDFTYVQPEYAWNPRTMQYELLNPESGWSVDNESNSITVTVVNADYSAVLSYKNLDGYELDMLFTDDDNEALDGGMFSIPDGESVRVWTMLTGDFNGTNGSRVPVGSLTVTLNVQ